MAMQARANQHLETMNFLNEIASDYPKAISFASGRPSESLFQTKMWVDALPRYLEYFALQCGCSLQGATQRLSQYGRTGGLINELVASQLTKDEGISCSGQQIIITSGCQEAITLTIQALCGHATDVIIVRNPCYIGITGAAHGCGIDLVAIDPPPGQSYAQALEKLVKELKALGRTPRAFYLTADFDNPTGSVLSMADRLAILTTCATYRIALLEDNPYGMFCFDGDRLPPMAALDREGVVIYLGTYSKTICPALRIGCIVIPQRLFGDQVASQRLAADLTQRKSFLTVNTSQFNQAVVGGVLLLENCSLLRLAKEATDYYRRNRDVLLGSLANAFDILGDDIAWNCPSGGFFLTADLPFIFDRNEAIKCAEKFDVILMPMSFFTLDGSRKTSIRIAFSNLECAEITLGVERFSDFVRQHL
jgi:(S)-3,5-dihydroxyphenylglycine transaminase